MGSNLRSEFDHTLHPIPRKECNWSNQSKWSKFNWGNRGLFTHADTTRGPFHVVNRRCRPTLFLRILPHLPMTLMRNDATKILPRFQYWIFCATNLNKPYQTWPKATSFISNISAYVVKVFIIGRSSRKHDNQSDGNLSSIKLSWTQILMAIECIHLLC